MGTASHSNPQRKALSPSSVSPEAAACLLPCPSEPPSIGCHWEDTYSLGALLEKLFLPSPWLIWPDLVLPSNLFLRRRDRALPHQYLVDLAKRLFWHCSTGSCEIYQRMVFRAQHPGRSLPTMPHLGPHTHAEMSPVDLPRKCRYSCQDPMLALWGAAPSARSTWATMSRSAIDTTNWGPKWDLKIFPYSRVCFCCNTMEKPKKEKIQIWYTFDINISES